MPVGICPYSFRLPGGIALPVLLGVLFILSSCNVTRHLDEAKGERLLVKNTLELQSEKKMGFSTRSALTSELTPYFRQKPNRRTLGFFYTRLWFYYKYRDRHSSLASFINKRVANTPVIFDSLLAQRTAANFKNQMKQRGYFLAEASYSSKNIGAHKIKAIYHLKLGPRYFVDNVNFTSQDSLILPILQATAGESLIKPGVPLDARIFDQEKLRISSILKNRGYAYFVPQFVVFGGDSTGTKANITVEVLPYNDSTTHHTYTIGKVEVLSSVVPNINSMRRDTMLGGVYFAAAESKLWIRPSILRKKILLNPGGLYKQADFDQTLRNLTALGVYSFVALRPIQDSVETDKINVTVSLSPNKRFSPGWDLDFNYSRNSISTGLLGLSPIVFLQNRNLLSGAEHLQTSASYNVEFDLLNPKIVFSQEFKFQNELAFPRFFDYFGFWKTLRKIHFGKSRLIPGSFYTRLRSDAEARFSLNFNNLKVTNFYRYNLFNASFGYRIRSQADHQFNWDHVGLDVLKPFFDSLLIPGEFLRLSFGKQLFTGLILRSFNYNYASRPNRFGEHWNYRFNFEMSGLEVLAANRLWPLITHKSEPDWRVRDLDFAKFFRIDQEGVYTRSFNENLEGAVRVAAGVAVPFDGSKAVPYVKQFFVGGPSSLRAWRIRELGPGSYVDDSAASRNLQTFYQAADFRFEFGGELRFPLFLWFKGAIFVDGGNIWTLKRDESRPGSELTWDSYKNIALGGGFGLRLDVDYFVLRLDFGVPLRRPYQDADGRYWIRDIRREHFNPNLAVGLPF